MAGTEYPGGMYGFGNRSGRLWSHPDYSVSGNKGKNDGFPQHDDAWGSACRNWRLDCIKARNDY